MRKSITIVEIGLTNQMMVLYAWYCFSSTEAISLAWSCGLLLTNHITVFHTKWQPSCPHGILPSCPHGTIFPSFLYNFPPFIIYCLIIILFNTLKQCLFSKSIQSRLVLTYPRRVCLPRGMLSGWLSSSENRIPTSKYSPMLIWSTRWWMLSRCPTPPCTPVSRGLCCFQDCPSTTRSTDCCTLKA